MTYGENGRHLRSELTTLLRQHRIQQRLGGPGSHTVPESMTVEQREVLGSQIQRFRYATLAWCLQAVVAATPRIHLIRTTEHAHGPNEDLRLRLTRSINASNAGLPPLDELNTPQGFPMVESWRQVARAAALGEHDFVGLMDLGRLTPAQSRTVLKDAAEVTRALVVLDLRYEGIPGWIPIRDRARLDRAAQVCGVSAGYDEPDYSVDHKGWRPSPATIDGGPLPGIGGVLQAEHNMLVHLSTFPNALNLRRVLDGQRILSHWAARLAPSVAPELIEKWLDREQTYKKLIDETRDVGGLVGSGGSAAAEAANAVGRLGRVHVDEITSAGSLRDLDKLFTRVDVRVAAVIEQGADDRLYFVSVKVPRLVDSSGELISPVRERYAPITEPINTDLLAITRHELRPPPVVPAVAAGAQDGREALRDSLEHRPAPHDGMDR